MERQRSLGALSALAMLLALATVDCDKNCTGGPRACELHDVSECANAGCTPILKCLPKSGTYCMPQPDTSEAECRAGNCLWTDEGCKGFCGVGVDKERCEDAGLRWLAADRTSCGLLTERDVCRASPDVCTWGDCVGTPKSCDEYEDCPITEGCDYAPNL